MKIMKQTPMTTINKNTKSGFLLPFSSATPGKLEKKKTKPGEPLITARPSNPSFGSFNVP